MQGTIITLAGDYATMGCFIKVVALSAASPPVRRGSGRSIPITKHTRLVNPNNTVSLKALDAHIKSIEAKIVRGMENYRKNTGRARPSVLREIEKRGAANPLTSDNGTLWYGTIEVGTPPKSFTVDFDTGSSDLFLPASTCWLNCNGHTLWDPSSSSTSKDLRKRIFLEFGDGSTVSVEEYTDTVSIAGYMAIGQTLGAASAYSSGFDVSNFAPDGLLGMAFESISEYGAKPVFQTLVSEGLVEPIFSFKFGSSGGELYIGGSNPSLYTGSFAYAPVTEEGFWKVTMENIQKGGQIILSNIDSVIDTGSALICGNPEQVSSLYKTLGGKREEVIDIYTFYSFPCNSFPNISFTFGGTSFPIPASTLNLGRVYEGSSDCLSGVAGFYEDFPFWVVGDVFLQGVYTAFDVGNTRVGFAQLA